MQYHNEPVPIPKDASACLAVLSLGAECAPHSALLDMAVDPSSGDRADHDEHDRLDLGQHARTVYWHAQVGVADNQLVIAAFESPPNPVLCHRPVPPAPKFCPPSTTLKERIAHSFHDHREPEAPHPLTTYPGVIDGKPLAAITVPLTNINSKHIQINTTKQDAAFIQVSAVGDGTLDDRRWQATMRFEFDNWMTSKAEAEVLATALGAVDPALPEAPAPAAPPAAETLAPPEGAPLERAISQDGLRKGRDNDGSTHPSGDAEYRDDWKNSVRGKW